MVLTTTKISTSVSVLSGYTLAKTQAEMKLETRYFFSILLSSYPKAGHQPPVIMQGTMVIQCTGRVPARF